METEIVWEDPPPHAGGRLGWFWAELKANPGRWARYPGQGTLSPAGMAVKGYEAMVRSNVQYVRFVKVEEGS